MFENIDVRLINRRSRVINRRSRRSTRGGGKKKREEREGISILITDTGSLYGTIGTLMEV